MVMCYRFVVNPGVFRPTYSSSVLLAPELLCHFCGAAWQDVEAPLIPLDAGPWASRMRGIVLVNQAAIETTACVRPGLWAIRQYQSSNHTASARCFDWNWEGGRSEADGGGGGGGRGWRSAGEACHVTPLPQRRPQGAEPGKRWASGECVMFFSPFLLPLFCPFLLHIHPRSGPKTDDRPRQS